VSALEEQTVVVEHRPSKTAMVTALVIGWSIIGLGVYSALADANDSHPLQLAMFVVGFDVFHDAILAPVVLVAAWLIARFVPAITGGPVRMAGAASAIVIAFAAPLVGGFGRRPTNSSTLPLDYGRNVLIVIAAVWVLAAVTIVVRIRRARTA
jgi:hypothetical protein